MRVMCVPSNPMSGEMAQLPTDVAGRISDPQLPAEAKFETLCYSAAR